MMSKFHNLKVGDRVETDQFGIATVVKIGCYEGTMVELLCDKKKRSCPYFYESELKLEDDGKS